MMLMLVPMLTSEKKGHVVSHFDHLDVINAMVPLMTLLPSCDTDINTNGIT